MRDRPVPADTFDFAHSYMCVTPQGLDLIVGDPDRVFPLASVTKPIAAYAALVAVDRGLLSLDVPAGPQGSTLRHLLAHASGLPFGRGEPIAKPGTRRIYSNYGYDVLGQVVAQSVGMPVQEWVMQAVAEPLGMDTFALVAGSWPVQGGDAETGASDAAVGSAVGVAGVVVDVSRVGGSMGVDDPVGVSSAVGVGGTAEVGSQRELAGRAELTGGAELTSAMAGSIAADGVASADSLARFALELLNPTLISPDLFEQAATPQFDGLAGILPGYGKQTNNQWGLGFSIRGHKHPHWLSADFSPRTIGHFGQSGSFIWMDPEVHRAGLFLGEAPFGWQHRAVWPALTAQMRAL
ncbi:MAG: serine hydrolase [Actinomycetaceae bacterium]|nr:serine hydrolase [Actinomycetaceae bacterium]MDY5854683.1 serine hydrolase domain-containing protein [Arcanobacterium sp.]